MTMIPARYWPLKLWAQVSYFPIQPRAAYTTVDLSKWAVPEIFMFVDYMAIPKQLRTVFEKYLSL